MCSCHTFAFIWKTNIYVRTRLCTSNSPMWSSIVVHLSLGAALRLGRWIGAGRRPTDVSAPGTPLLQRVRKAYFWLPMCVIHRPYHHYGKAPRTAFPPSSSILGLLGLKLAYSLYSMYYSPVSTQTVSAEMRAMSESTGRVRAKSRPRAHPRGALVYTNGRVAGQGGARAWVG